MIRLECCEQKQEEAFSFLLSIELSFFQLLLSPRLLLLGLVVVVVVLYVVVGGTFQALTLCETKRTRSNRRQQLQERLLGQRKYEATVSCSLSSSSLYGNNYDKDALSSPTIEKNKDCV